MKNSNRLGALVAFVLVASSCASLPVRSPSELVAEAAASCLETGPCVVLQVGNAILYDATVIVNGFRVGEVAGEGTATLFVRESLLIDGGCAQVTLYVRQLHRASTSAKECVRSGGRFRVSLDPAFHAWLTPGGEI